MCIIERKTYIHSDREQTVETTKLCKRAVGSSPCSLVEHRNVGAVHVVEARPRTSSDGVLITEGFNGRQRRYRDVSNRSSNGSSFRQSTVMSDLSPQPSPVSPPSSTSSPSYVEIKPKAPTPPSGDYGFPSIERLCSPYPPNPSQGPPLFSLNPPTSPPDPRRIITADGTAVYERPPSLELPRAANNERPRPSPLAREASASSMKAEVDDTVIEPSSSRRRGKRNITIDTSLRPSPPSSPSIESPGLSNLPGVRDSYRDADRHDSKLPEGNRMPGERLRRAEEDRRRREEDDRQARLERDRIAESDRRQFAREDLAREDASRERHRREAADALEGQRTDPIREQLNAEQAQMARERAAAARRRESDLVPRYADEQLPRRDTADRDRYYDGRTSPTATRTRRMTDDSYNYPSSPPLTRSSTRPVAVHQSSSSRRTSSISERGQDVIAREQARAQTRAATARLNNAVGDGSEEDCRDDSGRYERAGDAYIGEGQEGRRRRRHRRRERHE